MVKTNTTEPNTGVTPEDTTDIEEVVVEEEAPAVKSAPKTTKKPIRGQQTRGRQGQGQSQRGGSRGGSSESSRVAPRVVATRQTPIMVKPREAVDLPSVLTVKDLADALSISPVEIIKDLMKNGIMANINQQIDYDTAAVVAQDLGFETREAVPEDIEAAIEDADSKVMQTEKDPDAIPRPPVVTVMGHVDHGKTKLLDAIRRTNVVAGEAGGITQHIGAYQVEVQGKRITFLDTPGHAAFTAMRARGAQATDIAILVVAADDGVMPQTLEAMAHAKAAKVPIIVAINKIDKDNANPDRVKQQLSDAGLIPEDYGGETPVVEVSAKALLGIDDLLDVILLVAEIADLRANPQKQAVGTIIEASMDHAKGPLATVLVQNGTLNLRDMVVAGSVYGRIKAMYDDKGKRIRKAEPATPVEIMGLIDVPEAGDILQSVTDEKSAKVVAAQRARQKKHDASQPILAVTLDDVYKQILAGKVKELRVVLKADVQGSIEAIAGSLAKLTVEEIQVNVIHQGVGAISESDVMLAAASGAIIVGFNVRPDPAARRAADAQKVDIRFYNIIYNLIDDLELAMKGMLDAKIIDVTQGYADVRAVFKISKTEQAAGCYMTDGKANRNSLARVLRNGTVIFDGEIETLKRFKDDVREVASGYEFGLTLHNFNDFTVGDSIEFYRKEEVAR
jgi:translation initiation factor IF-2